jgi:uncharacterized Zn finger protein
MAKLTGRRNKANGDPPRFNVAALREFAGEKVFARGVAYHEDGRVEIISIDSARVLARVIGSEVYRSELKTVGRKFSGGCSCPAFSDWGFCKHLVAIALAANDLEPAAVEQAANRLSKIREHLRAKGIEPLIAMIMGLAERDPALFGDLELAAAEATADDQTLFAQFKKAITEVTRTGGFVEYREARDWAETIQRVLDRVANLIESAGPSWYCAYSIISSHGWMNRSTTLTTPMVKEWPSIPRPVNSISLPAAWRSLSPSRSRGICSRAR